jgi:hypothetical protein
LRAARDARDCGRQYEAKRTEARYCSAAWKQRRIGFMRSSGKARRKIQ